jgi:hypothetical protein
MRGILDFLQAQVHRKEELIIHLFLGLLITPRLPMLQADGKNAI